MLKQVDTPDGRYYLSEEGKKYFSVTTILHETKILPPALANWKARATPEQLAEADRKRDAGAVRGTAMHSMVDSYFETGEAGEGVYWDSIADFLTMVRPYYREKQVVHHQLGYAGTLDCVGSLVVDGNVTKNVLFDWKSADKPKRLDWITDYFEQCAAYAAAERKYSGVLIENACVVIALPKKKAQVIPLGLSDLQRHWKNFSKRVDRFYRQRTGSLPV